MPDRIQRFTICIPTYEYGGKGVDCLDYSFSKLYEQEFTDFDIVISDHSKDDEIERFCGLDHGHLSSKISYYRNPIDRGNAASNTNNAIRRATGEWIKVLCQDDYLIDEFSLYKIDKALDDNHDWFASGYVHTYNRKDYERYHAPYMNSSIHIVNTIGTPSCTAFRNIRPIMEFDENIRYAYDCEYYYRYFLKYGPPNILNDVTIANYLWGKSITAGITLDIIDKDNEYILKKHGFLK